MSKASKANNPVKNSSRIPRRFAYRITIYGRVQGVGFRPSVYRAARLMGIRGTVSNTPEGAVIETEGSRRRVDSFLKKIIASLPPRAAITRLKTERIPPRRFTDFAIQTSRGGKTVSAEFPADIALCENCRKELFTPSDRRYRYPFLNCTDCGPRFSIVRSLPYDRPKTTMSAFRMCPACRKEYGNPADRRFHAQPDACPVCGPKLSLLSSGFEKIAERDDAMVGAVRLLRSGKILAIKSLGGYHLACDAQNRRAVGLLRARKERAHKPLAVMLPDVESASRAGRVGPEEKKALLSAASPIVLLEKLKNGPLKTRELLAPGNASIGVMLPYTPLHHLLFAGKNALKALVMTSGNRRDEPICVTEDDAREKLSGIADYFLVHDRPIRNRCDDSIVQPLPHVQGVMTIIRRSRGYVPEAVGIGGASKRAPAVLSVGAELKNTFCLTRGGKAYVSPYIGDLDNEGSLAFFNESLERFRSFLKVKPSVIAHDLHPDYLSSVFARRMLANGRFKGVAVQHHHAHIASVLAEENIHVPVIGLSFDGTGYGADGTVWGGECLHCRGAEFSRLAHFEYFPLPGGDAATREIWRLAVSLLGHAGIHDLPGGIRRRQDWQTVRSMIKTGINSPSCCSVGRLFDGIAAIAGLRESVTFEAQAAMELEARAVAAATRGGLDFRSKKVYTFEILSRHKNGPDVVTIDGIIRGVWEDVLAGKETSAVSMAFHATLAEVIVALAERFGKKHGIRDVALSGGVFQNRLLLSLALRRLGAAGFRTHFNRIVPANDGGISLGQAWVASRKLKSGT